MMLEQFCVSYIKLDVVMMQVLVSDVDIQVYYDQYVDQFIQLECICYSIIQIKMEDDVKVVLDVLNKGEDFVMLVKEKFIDIIFVCNGGDMGWLEEFVMVLELKNVGLKEKGQIFGVIKLFVGFLVVCLDDIQFVKVKLLSEVCDDIVVKVK